MQQRLIVKRGDITEEAVDAIVNAANSTLLGGGGVDGAIHAKGGPAILEECEMIRATTHPDGLPTGEAVITTAGDLPAKFVIHTVGPIYGDHSGQEAELLASCYRNSVRLAVEHGLTSIAFPSISTGAYGYPKDEAAMVVFATVTQLLSEHDIEIRLISYSPPDTETTTFHSEFTI